MKWLVGVFLLAVSLALGASALAVAKPWPFDRRLPVQPIHYLVNGNPMAHARHTWRL